MSNVDGDCGDEKPVSDKNSVAIDIKQRLSAHVQSRMTTGQNVWSGETSRANPLEHVRRPEESEVPPPLSVNSQSETIKEELVGSERGPGGSELASVDSKEESGSKPDVVAGGTSAASGQGSGSFMAGSLVLSNSILDEVLNEKKLALLQSAEVIKFLRECQNKP